MGVNSEFQHFEYLCIRATISSHIPSIKLLFGNPNAINIINTYQMFINSLFDYELIAKNKNAMFILNERNDAVMEYQLWNSFADNPQALSLIKQYLKYFTYESWMKLMCNTNPETIPIIKKNIHKLDPFSWMKLYSNPNAISIIKPNIKDMTIYCYYELLKNPNARFVIETIIDSIKPSEYIYLVQNPNIVDLLYARTHLFNQNVWDTLASNINAIDLMKHYLEELSIDGWINLVQNPNAISIIEKHVDMIQEYDLWFYLVDNQNAIHIIENNIECLDESDLYNLCSNPSIFTYSYDTILGDRKEVNKEIIAAALHPKRVQKYLDMGYDILNW